MTSELSSYSVTLLLFLYFSIDINVLTYQCIALIGRSITNALDMLSLENGVLVISILNQQLIMNALFSGLFAGVVAVGATVALERFGGVLGDPCDHPNDNCACVNWVLVEL